MSRERVRAASSTSWRAAPRKRRSRLSSKREEKLRCVGDDAAIVKALGILVSNASNSPRPAVSCGLRVRHQGELSPSSSRTRVQGIDPRAMSKLGRPFEQGGEVMENGMKGSGLGLAIARALVDLHGGALRIRSRARHRNECRAMVRITPARIAPALTSRRSAGAALHEPTTRPRPRRPRLRALVASADGGCARGNCEGQRAGRARCLQCAARHDENARQRPRSKAPVQIPVATANFRAARNGPTPDRDRRRNARPLIADDDLDLIATGGLAH